MSPIKPCRSPATAATLDMLHSTNNSHQLINDLNYDLNNSYLQDYTSEQPYNSEDHHSNLNFLMWPDMQERSSLITCRCLSFLREQTSSDIKLQDQ